MGPRCSSAETQVCHRSYIIAATPNPVPVGSPIIDEDIIRYERVRKKGYLTLTTNYGPLNIELYCDTVPRTCENFLKHCKNGCLKRK
jgi:hypothetical protein